MQTGVYHFLSRLLILPVRRILHSVLTDRLLTLELNYLFVISNQVLHFFLSPSFVGFGLIFVVFVPVFH